MIIAEIACGIWFAIGATHVYWALGGTWGAMHVFPQPEGTKPASPKPWMAGVVAPVFFVFSFIQASLTFQSYLGVGEEVYRMGGGLLAGITALRAIGDFRYVGLTKRVRSTVFARMDTRYFTPLCIFLCLGAIQALFRF